MKSWPIFINPVLISAVENTNLGDFEDSLMTYTPTKELSTKDFETEKHVQLARLGQ